MSGVQAAGRLVCPECGHDAKRNRNLLKARPRWRVVVISVLIGLMSLYSMQVKWIVRDGWRGVLPTTVMIAAMLVPPDSWIGDKGSNGDDASLVRRLDQSRGWEWQRRWALRRACTHLEHLQDIPDLRRTERFILQVDPKQTGLPVRVLSTAVKYLASS